jgi:hypothetical protein
MAQNAQLPRIAATATRQSRVSPGGADGFHPRVHFWVTPRDPAGPTVIANNQRDVGDSHAATDRRPPTMHLSLSNQGRS